MKSLFKLLIAIFIISTLFVRSFAAVKIDAFDGGIEWQNAEYKLLIDKAHSNNVDYAYMKYQIDSNNYDVYFLIHLSDFNSASYDKAGVILTLLNDVIITVTSDNVTVEGNSPDYSVESEITANENDGVICEMRVGIKKGIPQNISGTVSCIDGNGVKSNYYPFTLNNPNVEESTTARSVNNVTEKIITEKTTRYREEKKTTNKTTKAVTTKKIEKTTKKKENKTVVYFYEKEVIVSQVYLTEIIPSQSVAETTSSEETATIQVSANASDELQQSDGMKIQKVICVLGGALLIGLGAWAGISVNKNKDSE